MLIYTAIRILASYCVIFLLILGIYLLFKRRSKEASSSDKISPYACGERGSPTDPPVLISYVQYLFYFAAFEFVPLLIFISLMAHPSPFLLITYLILVLLSMLILVKVK